MRRRPHRSPSAQRGVAALVVVLVLFLILSMVALYTSRNLIFEQKTSANVYRSTQAFEAAEAGLEWAIAMLNGGRVDDLCVGTDDTTRASFRDSHLGMNADGYVDSKKWSDAGVESHLHPSCVLGAQGWVCSCPSAADPLLAAPAGPGPSPAFRVTFEFDDVPLSRPGVVRVRSEGCANFGRQCVTGAAGSSDAIAQVTAVLGLAPALAQTPAAALTIRGTLNPGAAFQVTNTDMATNGVTIDAGGNVDATNLVLSTLPGNPAESSIARNDVALSGLASAGGLSRGEMMFLATFGMPPVAYRTQPAVVRITCANPCNERLQTAADQYPGRVLWIDGDLDIDAGQAVALGGPLPGNPPVILVVGGNINVGNGSDVTIAGMVYSRGATWTVGDGATVRLNGAFVAEGTASPDPALDGSFSIIGAPTIAFDRDIVDHLTRAKARRNMDFGSFVRVPGSWKDWKEMP